MFIFLRILFGIFFFMILSGCVQQDTTEIITVPKKQNTIIKKDTKLKNEIKPMVKTPLKKKVTYKYCSKHTKIMNYASNYIIKEFDKGYFVQKDIVGAKAQLFLIENKSPTVFAKNINAAQESYNKQYQLAKKNKCNLRNFRISPLDKVRNTIKILEKKKDAK